MDNQKLGEVIGASIGSSQPPLAEDIALAFTNEEIIAAAESRGLTLAKVAAEGGQVATANLVVAPVEIPKIDDETSERLETLSPYYAERVVARYAERYSAVDGYIRAGKLPESYRLPLLGELIDRVVAVAPAFEQISKSGGKPEFDFVPQGLSIDAWSSLLAGHKLPNGNTTNGAYRYHDINEVTDPTNPNPNSNLWDAAVMDVSEKPQVRGISTDGSKAVEGVNLKKTIKGLRETHKALGLPELDPSQSGLSADELVIKQLSPDESTVFAMQLGRLERGQQPLDVSGWTICKENVKVDRTLWWVFTYFVPDFREAYSDYGNRDIADDSSVVRVSARGKDFIPQS